MNTDYIYVSNIPSNFKPVLLLHELENKWARMLYLENTFSGLRDAFIYNPTKVFEHFQRGVQKLRDKVIEGTKPLTVFYVWFPPENVFVTTMIPQGASMLSYIFVENLHKDIIAPEIIYDLPLQAVDVKVWDIPERLDKCLIIKLPVTSNNAMRSFVLGTLRSRKVRGAFPRASELIISEQSVLSQQMAPRSVKVNHTNESYMSNFFYLHDVPSKLTVKMLIETAKADNIKGCRVFFVETHNNMKYGFMYLPRSLPHTRFMALFDKLASTDFALPGGDSVRVKIQESWFRPTGAEAPLASDDVIGDSSGVGDVADDISGHPKGHMILTDYLHVSGVPANMPAAQLALTCPYPIKLGIFPVNELSSQVGFIVLRGLTDQDVTRVMSHFRNLEFGGTAITIDEIYIRCDNLPASLADRPFQLVPRRSTEPPASSQVASRKRPLLLQYQQDGVANGYGQTSGVACSLSLTEVPPDEYSLMKTEFICVGNLPKNVAKAALIFDINQPSQGCVIVPDQDGSTSMAFIYYPDCELGTWRAILARFATKQFGGRRARVHEVYLQTSKSLTSVASQHQFRDASVVFAYNISREVLADEIHDIDRTAIDYVELLETTNGSKSAFLVINSIVSQAATSNSLSPFGLLELVRKTYLRGKPIYADLIKLACVTGLATP